MSCYEIFMKEAEMILVTREEFRNYIRIKFTRDDNGVYKI